MAVPKLILMEQGDFLMVDYVGRIASTGEIFDLTDGDLARREGIHDPKQRYKPVLVIIGAGMIVPGVEEQLKGMSPGEEREFEVSQDKAFGRRDPRLIKVLSHQRFVSQKVNPVPGAFVNIDGRHARIQSVSGGRVRADFNSPLAGKDLVYRVRIVRHIKPAEERAQALLDHYGLEARASLKEGVLTVSTEDQLPDPVKDLLNKQMTRWVKEAKRISYAVPGKRDAKKASGKPGQVAGDGDAKQGPQGSGAPQGAPQEAASSSGEG